MSASALNGRERLLPNNVRYWGKADIEIEGEHIEQIADELIECPSMSAIGA